MMYYDNYGSDDGADDVAVKLHRLRAVVISIYTDNIEGSLNRKRTALAQDFTKYRGAASQTSYVDTGVIEN